MKIKIELRHKTLGICDTEIACSETSKDKIILRWRYKYGKTIDKCTIVSKVISYLNPGRKSRPVINKATGDIYQSIQEAAKELGIHPTTVLLHCKNEFNSGKKNQLKYA
ncbi:MAG: hypothetical protein H7320_14210 [Ferruginibacter sp.]|nr:hypothetical protein [Ferruginibacter sp.]